MIVYADSSALIGAYAQEPISAAVRQHLEAADAVNCSILGWAECLAAFARIGREGRLPASVVTGLERSYRSDWQQIQAVRLDPRLRHEIARLVGQHPLRGADAVHLASALVVHRRLCGPLAATLVFLANDAVLCRAAAGEGLAVPELAA
jgi:predicted nucleic acid-binding protein